MEAGLFRYPNRAGGIIILLENMSEFSNLYGLKIESFGVTFSDVDDWGDENDVREDSGGGGGDMGPSEFDRLFGLSTLNFSVFFVGEMERSGLRQATDDLSSSLGSVEKGRKFGFGLIWSTDASDISSFFDSSFFCHVFVATELSLSKCRFWKG